MAKENILVCGECEGTGRIAEQGACDNCTGVGKMGVREHDEHIRKEERARVKEKLIEKITERNTTFDRVDIEVFFAQLEKEL